MKRIFTGHNRNKYVFLCTVLINTLLSVIFLCIREPYYGTVDDSRMRDIASGAMTGIPNAHLIFIQYPLGFLISSMYKILPNLPWYLIFMIGSMILSLSIVLYCALCKCKDKKDTLTIITAYLLLFLLCFKQLIVYPQFTTTAGMLGATAIIWYVFMKFDESKMSLVKNALIFLGLIVMCYMYRTLVLMMMLPLMMIIIFVKNWKGDINRRKILYDLGLILASGVAIIAVTYIDNIHYKNNEYSSYREFNRIRSYINDYYKMPNYESNKDFFEEIGLTEIEWKTVSNYSLMLGDDIKMETLEKVVELQEKVVKNNLKENLKRAILNIYPSYKAYWTFRWPPFFITICAVTILLILLLRKRWTLFLYLGAATAMGIFGSIYFIYTLRFPQRVAETLWLPLTFLIIYILHDTAAEFIGSVEKKDNLKKVLFPSSWIILLILGGVSIYRNELADSEKYEFTKNESENYVFMIDYSRENNDNFYYYYVYSFADASDKFQICNEEKMLSFTSLGGWLTRSPLMDEKYHKYGFDSTEDALLNHDNVFVAVAAGQDMSFLNEFVEEKYSEYEWKIDKKVNKGKIDLLSLELKN